VDRVPASTALEVREGEVQITLTTDKIMRGLVNRVFGLDAQARGSQDAPWSPLMKRPEFIDVSPDIHFDASKNPPGVDGILCAGPDPRIIMDIVRIYRRTPEFSKTGFVFPAILPDSPTIVQRVRMSRLHDSLYSFYICDALSQPSGDFFMDLCVVNLSERGTSTSFSLRGARVPEESEESLRFDLPPGHLDIRRVRLIAPARAGRHRLAIRSESRSATFAKDALVYSAAFLAEAAVGKVGGIGVHILGALLAAPMELNAELEAMDQRRNQILSDVSKVLDAKGVKGIRTRYGDVVPREEMWKSFVRFISIKRLNNISEEDWSRYSDNQGEKLFVSFAELEYGVQVSSLFAD
jgi:hypothetical protein